MSTTEVITESDQTQALTDQKQTVRSEAETAKPPAAPPRKWLMGPWIDLFLVANVAWPLIAAAIVAWPALLSGNGFYFNDGPLSILQLYFISTPHRWITLVLVFCDPDRFRENSRKFIGYGSALMLFGVLLAAVGYLTVDGRVAPGANLSTRLMESLAFMMMVDFMWNSWHFAAQHAGINAIYRRMGQVEKSEKQVAFEMSSIRLLVLWTFIRIGLVATASKHNLFAEGGVGPFLIAGDVVFFGRAAYVIVKDLIAGGVRRPGRSLYLTSMLSLYAAILVAIQFMNDAWIKGLLISQAIFHGTEYLAVVYWSVQKRRSGIWKYHVARGVIGIVLFVAIIGIGNWALDRQSAYIWALLTLLVSLLHYSYDGMIWKSKRKRKPAAVPDAPAETA
jgi:hypothetical protein